MRSEAPAYSVKVALLVAIDDMLAALECLLTPHLTICTTAHADATETLGFLMVLAARLVCVPRV